MQLTSPVFVNQATLPQKYTCQGEGIRPPLEISEAPDETKSFVLIVDDPDAIGGLFTHWIVWSIPPETIHIEENSTPVGAVEGMNSGGKIGWFPPCPPKGTGQHHYRFQLLALDTDDLAFGKGTSREDLENAIKEHEIGRAELVGMYP